MAAGHCRPTAGTSLAASHALRQQLQSLCQKRTAQAQRYIVTTGNEMQNQFKPWYFGIAFAFLFKYCTGMPDMPAWSKQPRHKRKADAPRVDLPLWVKLMTRRVEQHLKRDWMFGFTMGSVLFRSLLNQCKTIYSYEKIKREDGGMGLTAAELEAGAISLCSALDGKYKDLDGNVKQVKGDFAKITFARI